MTDARTRSLLAHLEGLSTWGIEHIVGGGAPARSKPEAAPSNGRSGDGAERAPGTPPRSDAQASQASTPRAPRTRPEPVPEVDPSVSSAPPAARPAAASAAPHGENQSESKTEILRAAAEDVASCTRCPLSETRTRTAYGVGDADARLMFVGEAPGRDEDLQGEPFVGAAGQLLNRIIGALGVGREDVYIANVLKCRPPNNRDPRPDETACCTPFLLRQIDVVAPQMIVALGRPAANFLLETTDSLARLRGRLHSHRGIPVVATYHPAYLLRTPEAKKKVWQDLQVVIERLGLPGPPSRPARDEA